MITPLTEPLTDKPVIPYSESGILWVSHSV